MTHSAPAGPARRLRRTHVVAILAALAAAVVSAVPARAQAGAPNGEWPAWGGGDASTRYSPLAGIHRGNVDRLEVVWRWKMDNFGPEPEVRSQTVPVMVNGVLYATAGMNRDVVAIDAATGQTLWTYRVDEGVRSERAPRRNSGRGVAYWSDGADDDRVLLVTPGFHLVALAPFRASGGTASWTSWWVCAFPRASIPWAWWATARLPSWPTTSWWSAPRFRPASAFRPWRT